MCTIEIIVENFRFILGNISILFSKNLFQTNQKLFILYFRCRTINYDCIDRYGHFLKEKGVEGVLVNGWTGEGMTLGVEERKKVTEEWVKCGKKYGLKVCLLVGGCTTLADTYDIAEHAERCNVDCVLVVPDPFYRKHMTEEDLIW